MSDTTEPTVPETVPATSDVLSDLDTSSLAEDETPQEVEGETPAEGEVKDEDTGETPVSEDDAPAEDGPDGEDLADVVKGAAEAEETPAEPEKPAKQPQAKAEPAKTDPDDEARSTRAARIAEINKELKALRDVKDEEYDAFDHGRKINKLLAEKDELRDAEVDELKAEAAQRKQADAYENGWKQWARANPDIGDKGRSIFEEEYAKAAKKYTNHEAIDAVARERAVDRINLIRRQREAAAAKKVTPKSPARAAATGKPPVTKGGGQIVPRGAVAGPAVVETDPDKLLVQAIGGKMKGFFGT